jgi:hypothetical protein
VNVKTLWPDCKALGIHLEDSRVKVPSNSEGFRTELSNLICGVVVPQVIETGAAGLGGSCVLFL